MLHALQVFIACDSCTVTLLGPPKQTESKSIITMYGSTEVLPAVHGCLGNFIFLTLANWTGTLLNVHLNDEIFFMCSN